jgi:hypothetical protein
MSIDLDKIELEPVEVEKPLEKEPPKTKVTKKVKSYSKGRYTRLPPTKTINKAVVAEVNKRFLKEKKTKLTLKECEIGESMMYLVEYYAELDIHHPVLIFFGVTMALGLRVQELQGGPDA